MAYMRAKDRIGTTVNNFKILDTKRENGRTYFYVICPVCDAKKWMRDDTVKSPNVVSCGCYNKENNIFNPDDIKDKIFGRLKAIELTDNRDKNNGSVIWKCKCRCEKITYVSETDLKRNRVRSCGCLGIENSIKNGKIAAKNIVDNFCIDGTNVKNLTMSTPKSNTSGIKGVTWDKAREKWAAQIRFKGKNYHLGRYNRIEDAAEIRRIAEEKIFGDFLKWFAEEFPERWKKIHK